MGSTDSVGKGTRSPELREAACLARDFPTRGKLAASSFQKGSGAGSILAQNFGPRFLMALQTNRHRACPTQ